jgi:hypothetical protein
MSPPYVFGPLLDTLQDANWSFEPEPSLALNIMRGLKSYETTMGVGILRSKCWMSDYREQLFPIANSGVESSDELRHT